MLVDGKETGLVTCWSRMYEMPSWGVSFIAYGYQKLGAYFTAGSASLISTYQVYRSYCRWFDLLVGWLFGKWIKNVDTHRIASGIRLVTGWCMRLLLSLTTSGSAGSYCAVRLSSSQLEPAHGCFFFCEKRAALMARTSTATM